MARLAGPVEPRPVCAAGHNEPPGCLHADVVNLAQQKNVNAGDAFDWYIDNLGRACLYNAVDMSFEQGVMSFVRPNLFDKDSAECASQIPLGAGAAALSPASLPGETSDGTYDAIPIPGMQNVPCDLDTCGLP